MSVGITHAVGEEGTSIRDIAVVVGRGLNITVVSFSVQEAQPHFGWLSMFAGMNMPASNAQTCEKLQWKPTGSRLISDLEKMRYF